MRIFYTSMSSPNSVVLADSKLWDINLRDGLEQHGSLVLPSFSGQDHHMQCVYGSSEQAALARADFSQRLVDDVKRAHESETIDLFFSYLYSRSVLPAAIREISALGIPTVNFYCNSIHQFDLISEIAPAFDFCMFPERDARADYERVGANPIHIQMAANPRYYRPYECERQYDVTFVGGRYLNRGDYCRYLFDRGVDLRVWGPRWLPETSSPCVGGEPPSEGTQPERSALFHRAALGLGWRIRALKEQVGRLRAYKRARDQLPAGVCGPPLSDEELVRMYSRSSVNLGFSEVEMPDGSYKRHIRLRDFEAPMSGALYLTGMQEELAEYYEIGKEIVCYDTKEELLDRVQFLLSHPDTAEQIRQAGLARARRDHTWERRLEKLFREMGLKPSKADR